jgi:hypothetical protein
MIADCFKTKILVYSLFVCSEMILLSIVPLESLRENNFRCHNQINAFRLS